MLTENRIAVPNEPHEVQRHEPGLSVLYNARQAAHRLGCSQAAIRSYWARGVLERLKVGALSKVSERGCLEFMRRSLAAARERKNNSALALEGLRKSREARKQKK